MIPCPLLGAVLPNSSTQYIFQIQAVCLLYICSGFFCLIWVQNLVISLCTVPGKLLSLYATRCCQTSAFTGDVFCLLKLGRIYDFPHVLLSPIIKLMYPNLLSNPNYIIVLNCCHVHVWALRIGFMTIWKILPWRKGSPKIRICSTNVHRAYIFPLTWALHMSGIREDADCLCDKAALLCSGKR